MAGLEDLQARDLRRTACVRMAEAGAIGKQIASVTGHSIETTRQILETYIPTTVEMARGAIEKLESACRLLILLRSRANDGNPTDVGYNKPPDGPFGARISSSRVGCEALTNGAVEPTA